MDCLLSRLPCVRAVVEPYSSSVSAEHAQLLGVALISLAAVYMGYLYILSRKEAAVTFNVPLPQEVRKNGQGKKWGEVQGQEKRVLEDQARGVSFHRAAWFCLEIRSMLMAELYAEME
jgi:hypothetical protein